MRRAANQQIKLQRQTEEIDDRGEHRLTWATIATLWADLRELSGKSRTWALQSGNEVTWRAFVRYTPGLAIRLSDRLLYKTKPLDIVAVIDLYEQHRVLQIDLKESV